MATEPEITAEVRIEQSLVGPAAALIVHITGTESVGMRAWGMLNPSCHEISQLEAIAGRINGIGDPRAAKLDLRPVRKFDWREKLFWAYVGWMCGAASVGMVFVMGRL
jgi:hypothetical protein